MVACTQNCVWSPEPTGRHDLLIISSEGRTSYEVVEEKDATSYRRCNAVLLVNISIIPPTKKPPSRIKCRRYVAPGPNYTA